MTGAAGPRHPASFLFFRDPARVRELLTGHCVQWGSKVVERAWRLGDELWTKYDEKF